MVVWIDWVEIELDFFGWLMCVVWCVGKWLVLLESRFVVVVFLLWFEYFDVLFELIDWVLMGYIMIFNIGEIW